MNYITFGNKKDKAIVFIHGMASTALLCYEPLLKYFEHPAEYVKIILRFFSGRK